MTDTTEAAESPEAEWDVPAVITTGSLTPTVTFAEIVEQDYTVLAPQMLDSQQKEALAGASHEFTLLAIKLGADDSGAFWSHLVDLGGTLATFRLQCHEARDRTAQQLAAALESRGPIGGLVLKSLSEKLGNQFLVLWPAGRK